MLNHTSVYTVLLIFITTLPNMLIHRLAVLVCKKRSLFGITWAIFIIKKKLPPFFGGSSRKEKFLSRFKYQLRKRQFWIFFTSTRTIPIQSKKFKILPLKKECYMNI